MKLMDEKEGIVREEVKHLPPIITERTVWNMSYLILAFIIGLSILFIDVFFIIRLKLSISESIAMSSSLIAIYSIFLFFLIEPRIVKQIEKRSIMTRVIQGSPIIRTVEKPVYRDVIKTVEKPVYRDLVKTVEKPVYVDRVTPVYKVLKNKKSVPVKRYKYVGSTITKKYHLANSRLARLIKKDNRVYSNDIEDFEKRGYKPARHVIKKMKGAKKKEALNEYKKHKSHEKKKKKVRREKIIEKEVKKRVKKVVKSVKGEKSPKKN
jgi:hypothetical protein